MGQAVPASRTTKRKLMLKLLRQIGAVSAISLLATIGAFSQTSAQKSNWKIDPAHSTAQFTVRHFGISNVSGIFTKVSGNVALNEKDITQSQVEASIDV